MGLRFLCLFLFFASCFSSNLVVQTDTGAVKGVTLQGGTALGWLGVPYANNNRFEQPTAVFWDDVLDASHYGPACPQVCVLPAGSCPEEVQDEKRCLNLNIYTPASPSNKLREVLVFIPGGAFLQGAAGVSLYDASRVVNRTDVVVVTINYRLGVLGFFINEQSNGNYGIYDQRFALQWIQRNIKNFGGDPASVTLWGQSAGAMSVIYHLVASDFSKGLFQKAIVQSDPFTIPMFDKTTGEIFTKVLGKKIGCDANDIDCFKNCTGKCLQTMLEAENEGSGVSVFHPFTSFLPNLPMVGEEAPVKSNVFELLDARKTLDGVPILFSVCANDSTLFMGEAFGDSIGFAEYVGLLGDIFGVLHVPRITELYPSLTSDTQRLINLELLTQDYLFWCPMRHLSSTLSSKVDVFRFVFDHKWSFSYKGWGPNYTFCDQSVCHGEELPFEFASASYNFTLTPQEETLTNEIVDALTNFAKTSDVNTPFPLTQKWADAGTNATYVFATPSYSTNDYRKIYCDFWDELGYEFGGNKMLSEIMKRRTGNKVILKK